MDVIDSRALIVTATRAAKKAGKVILDNLGRISKADVSAKQSSDFVTYVDRESEQLIVRTIRERFPSHSFMAEESFRDERTDGYRWIIDPLDGTTNFIHGYPQFSVSIALEYGPKTTPPVKMGRERTEKKTGEIILGIVFDPLRKEFFTSQKNRGAFLNGRRLRVSSVSSLKESLVTTGFPFRKKELIDPYLELFKRIFHKVSDIRRTGSAALDLAHVAAGRCEAFFELGLGTWDMAAGSLIIREAGGIVSDFGGSGDYLSTGNIVAAAPVVHRKILREVQHVFHGIIDR